MLVSPVRQIRNLGIVAHINAGKTTLSERMLHTAGRVRFMGEVDHGTAAMDYLPEEQRRGISIRAANTSMHWRDCVLNLVDTPGHVDFGAEVERALRVLDGAVLVLDGVRGVESQTEAVWRQAKAHGVPALAFVNKLDRPVADWSRALQSMRDRLQVRVLPAVVPLLGARGLAGLADVVTGVVTRWDEEGAPASDLAQARAGLVEAAADFDASIMDDFVRERPIDDARLRAALRTGVTGGHLILAFAGSALRNHGVAHLLDAVCDHLPSPLDIPPVRGVAGGERAPREDSPTCALVFRTFVERGEELAVVRVYSGVLVPGTSLGVGDTGVEVVVRALWRLHAEERESVARAGPGDIVAISGDLGAVVTGTTLYMPGHAITLAPARFLAPVLSVVIEPRHVEDRATIEAGVRRLVRTDPTLETRVDPERDVLLLTGMGELHLEVANERLRADVGDCFRIGRPEVALRETVGRAANGVGEWRVPELSVRVAVGLRIAPAPGSGPARVRLANGLAGQELAVQLAGALTGLTSTSLRAGWPAYDVALEVLSIEHRAPPAVDVLPMCVEAAKVALRRALADAEPVVLQPLVRLEVACPHDSLSPVLGDLRGKLAHIEAVEVDGEVASVRGTVPLIRMLGYATRLRSLTRGLGSFHLHAGGYEPAPVEDGG